MPQGLSVQDAAEITHYLKASAEALSGLIKYELEPRNNTFDEKSTTFQLNCFSSENFNLVESKVIPPELKDISKSLCISYQKSFHKTVFICHKIIEHPWSKVNLHSIYKRFENELAKDLLTLQINRNRDEGVTALKGYLIAQGLDVTDCTGKPSPGGKGRTRYYTNVTTLLDSIFDYRQRPNSKERTFIATQCGLSPKQVRIWFTNKRARSKRYNCINV